MGCWQATCGLSGLPIFHGERAKLVLLTQGVKQYRDPMSADGISYPDDLWTPVVWPLSGLYDDYGLIEEIKVSAPTLFKRRVLNLTASDSGGFFERLAKGSLGTSHESEAFYNGKLMHASVFGSRLLGHVLVREDVWDLLLSYDATDWPKSVRSEARKSLEKDVDDAIAWAKKLWAVPENKRFSVALSRDIASELQGPPHVYRWFKALMEEALHAEVEREHLVAASQEVADLRHLQLVMQELRLAWAPGRARGSQDGWAHHEEFHMALAGIAGEAKRKLREEFGE